MNGKFDANDREPVTKATACLVLNVGSGPTSSNRLHRAFAAPPWREVRLDIDPQVQPDIVGTIKDMNAVPDGSFDAIWSSHNIEHLYPHEVVPALKEFKRVLKRDGFALITCPDLEAACELALKTGVDATAYVSAAGPITPLEMIFGHARSIADGNLYMCHHCGFSAKTLAAVALRAGFMEARVARGKGYDLWALLLTPDTDRARVRDYLKNTAQIALMDG